MAPPPLPAGEEEDEDVDLSGMLASAPAPVAGRTAQASISGGETGLPAGQVKTPGTETTAPGGESAAPTASVGMTGANDGDVHGLEPVLTSPAAGVTAAAGRRVNPAPSAPRSAPDAASPADSTTVASIPKGRRGSSLIAPLPEPFPFEQGCRAPTPDGGCRELALEPFFRSLARTARQEPGAVTRITHFGDSIIASDYISATVRRRLQRVWGDSGHGFLLAARPWRWYDHRGAVHNASNGWLTHGVVFNRFKDRLFGFGGVSFQTGEEGLTAEFGTATSGPMGRAVSRFELYYQEQPGGGSVDLIVNRQVRHRLKTAGDRVRSAFYALEVADGPAKLSLRTVGDGRVRLFGVTLERTAPGVVYDSVGIVGGSMSALRKIDGAHWAEQLRHRSPDLVVLSFGANESLTYHNAGPKVMKDYERSQSAVLRQIRAALPEASILVMGPMDAAERVAGGMRTRPSIPKMAAAQRRAALSVGAAYWDTLAVMGGEGSMTRWVKARLGSSDLVHPSWTGAVFLGNELSRSLVAGFKQAQDGTPGAGARIDAPPARPAIPSAVPADAPGGASSFAFPAAGHGPAAPPEVSRPAGAAPPRRQAATGPDGVTPARASSGGPHAVTPAQATGAAHAARDGRGSRSTP